MKRASPSFFGPMQMGGIYAGYWQFYGQFRRRRENHLISASCRAKSLRSTRILGSALRSLTTAINS